MDRDGEVFNHVVYFLRNDFVAPPFENKTIQGKFEQELKFWKLKSHQLNSDSIKLESKKLPNSIKLESKKTDDYIKMESELASDPRSTSEAAQKKWKDLGPLNFS